MANEKIKIIGLEEREAKIREDVPFFREKITCALMVVFGLLLFGSGMIITWLS